MQQFIKDEFGSKFGYARIPYEPDENSYLTLELFANKESADIYDAAEDKEAEEIKQLITEVVIPIPTVEGDGFTSALSTTIKGNNVVVVDNNFEVEFNFRAIRHTKGSTLNEGALGTLLI